MRELLTLDRSTQPKGSGIQPPAPVKSEVFAVRSHEVDAWWDKLRPHLERFEQETGRTDAKTIKRQAKDKQRQIWGVRTEDEVTGVLVTEIYTTATGLICWIWVAVGMQETPHEFVRIYLHIEDWARELGCTRIGICGRKGWMRIFPDFEQTAVVLEKSL